MPLRTNNLLEIWYFVILTFALFVAFSLGGCQKSDDFERLNIQAFPERQRDFSLWQLAQFNYEVQMCYIIRTDDCKIIVVDGGMPTSSNRVTDYLQQFGGYVHSWIITHPHLDHIGVLQKIIDEKKIRIDRILHSKLDEDWVVEHEVINSGLVRNYNEKINESVISIINVKKDEVYNIGDGVELEIIAVKNDSITVNAINNSSLVFKIKSKSKSVLFLGDLGVEGGNAILNSVNPARLHADFVQMSHHGQGGVGLNFYKLVNADYALWPTPKWLWENRARDKGPGTGKFQTPEVRAWTENELNIKKNYVAGIEGNIQID